MPTDDQARLSPLLRRIRRQMQTDGYRCLAEQVSVEQVVFAYAHAVGVPVGDVMREWCGAGAPTGKRISDRKSVMRVRADDDDPPVNDLGDVADEEQQEICPACGGSGTKDGDECAKCNGTGRVPDEEDGDDEREDEE
jgi:hypothetical protein